jgi:hypothetical protein
MISLVIKPYCNDCPKFEAETEKLYFDGAVTETRIKCANAEKCAAICRYINQQKREVAQND